MAPLSRLRSRVSLRVVAGLISVALHFGLFSLIVFTGDRYEGSDDGETPAAQVVLLESHLTERKEISTTPALQPPLKPANLHVQLAAQNTPPAAAELPNLPVESMSAYIAPAIEPIVETDTQSPRTIESPSTFVMPPAETSDLLQRLTRLAEELVNTPQSQVTWEQDGRQYSAKLILERATDSVAFDHALAEVSAQDRGKHLTTRVMLKRLAFSHFTQIVDRWDPMVQLHDDEIVGRFHVNSRFNLMYDGQAAPKFLGKVTTAARSFSTESSGHRRRSDIFQGGIETSAGRIALPAQLQPFEWAPRDNARLHELTDDTRIRFFADGSYSWREGRSSVAQYRNEPSDQPVYFVATRGATIHVQGVVSGKVLVYSPQRIVVAGALTYAHDPRNSPDSRDYLGLVCDRDVEVAPPFVTGAGDLDIHAAIYAGRRFVVTDIDHARTATLRIYGSLAAGSLSASEPRYAVKIAYDSRLEQQRPPGFPSTNRFAADDWDGQWTEASDRQ